MMHIFQIKICRVKLQKCWDMKAILITILILSILDFVKSSTVGTMRKMFDAHSSLSILDCSQGHLTGFEDFADLFKSADSSCGHYMHELNTYYNCIAQSLGIVNEEGRPDLEYIDQFFGRLVSEKLLARAATFKEGLSACADAYVSSYSRMTEIEILTLSGELAGTFVYCVIDEEEMFSEAGDKVCAANN